MKARLLGPAHNRHETSPSREGGREAAYLQGDLGVADLLLLAFVMLGDAQVQLVVGLLQLQDTPCQDGKGGGGGSCLPVASPGWVAPIVDGQCPG